MADKKQGYLQKAKRQMKKKGTIGAFTDYCGGKVTNDCIERALNSNDDTLRRRAQFAKNVRAQSGLMNEKFENGGATATAPPASQPVAPNVMQPIQQQPIQQQQPMQQQLLQQPQQLPQANAAPASEDPTAAGVNAASNVAQTVGQGLEQSGGPGSSKQVGGKALGGAAKGAAFGANPALVAATGGLSIAAGALIGGASGFIKGKKEQKQIEGQDLASQQTQGFQQIQQMDQLPQAMYGAMRMEKGGAKKLPGGVMKPIGYGAYKFMGNKHDEAGMGSDSGIILEEGGKKKRGLEVEDGELQVDVDTKDGEKEYIVSNYIKNPTTGNTLAEDLEKELKKARNQEEADAITAKYVKLNEKLRGEEGKPEKIKAQEGEFTSSFDELPPEYEGNVMTSEDARIGENFQHLETEGENAGLWGGVTKKDIKRTKDQNPWYDFPEGFDGTDSKENEKFQQAAKDRAIKAGLPAPEVDGKFGLQTASIRLDKPAEEVKKLEAKVESATPEAKLQGEKKDVEVTTPSDKPDRVKKERGPKLPYAGTPFQAFGDIAGLLKNYDVTPNLMAPAYAKEIRMGRVNLDPERAAAAQQTQATSQGITSGLAGPAAFAMQQKNLSAGQQGQRGITDQENRANIQIAGQEKGTNVGIRQGNQQASMTAGQYNATAKDRAALTNRDNKMYKTELAQNIGDTAAQTIADNQQIRGDFFQAQASQVDGEFDRAYQTYGFNPRFGRNVTLRPEGGTTLSPEQIQATYRNAMAEQQTTQSKRGSYTTKPGKIKRKKRKR